MMALLPGYTKTAFPHRAGMTGTHMPRWMRLTSEQVVAAALKDLERGRTVSIPSVRYRLLSQALRHLPRAVTTRFSLDRSLPLEGVTAAPCVPAPTRWPAGDVTQADS